jgi:hypothetical protein
MFCEFLLCMGLFSGFPLRSSWPAKTLKNLSCLFLPGEAPLAVSGWASDQFNLALDGAPEGELKEKILAALKSAAGSAGTAQQVQMDQLRSVPRDTEGARSAKPLR